MIEIINFEDEYAEDFRRLNLEWLHHYGLAESHDLEILHDPQATIIDGGGCIFLARQEGAITGTAALMKADENEYELAKMAVTRSSQGMGVGKLLLTRCVDQAKEWRAKRIILFSNHQLQTALSLYRQFGFKDIPVQDSPFITADVKMEMILTYKLGL